MTATTATKEYLINDEGDAFELVLIEDGQQVGGGVFPFVLGVDEAFDLARGMGEAFSAL